MRGQVPGVGEVVESEPTTKCAASVARLTPVITQTRDIYGLLCRGVRAMNEVSSHQNDDEQLLQFEVPDAFLESSAGGGHDDKNAFTQWVCTALYFCPGP